MQLYTDTTHSLVLLLSHNQGETAVRAQRRVEAEGALGGGGRDSESPERKKGFSQTEFLLEDLSRPEILSLSEILSRPENLKPAGESLSLPETL